MKCKLVPCSKAHTYYGGLYQYDLYVLTSDDIDGTWEYSHDVYGRSIHDAMDRYLASRPEKELEFNA